MHACTLRASFSLDVIYVTSAFFFFSMLSRLHVFNSNRTTKNWTAIILWVRVISFLPTSSPTLLDKAVGSSPIGPVWAGPTFGAWWVW